MIVSFVVCHFEFVTKYKYIQLHVYIYHWGRGEGGEGNTKRRDMAGRVHIIIQDFLLGGRDLMVKVLVAFISMPTSLMCVCHLYRRFWGLLTLQIASDTIWDKISLCYSIIILYSK